MIYSCPNCRNRQLLDNSYIGRTYICEKCFKEIRIHHKYKLSIEPQNPNLVPLDSLKNPKKSFGQAYAEFAEECREQHEKNKDSFLNLAGFIGGIFWGMNNKKK